MIIQCKNCGKVFGVILKEKEDGVTLKKINHLEMDCPYCGNKIIWRRKNAE